MANGESARTVDIEAITQAWSRAATALDDGNRHEAAKYGVKALELDPDFLVHAPVAEGPQRRVTGHELVPHTWALYVPHLAVVAVARSFWAEFSLSAEIQRFADGIGDFAEPTWVRYDPWVWTMHIEYSRGDPQATPLTWPGPNPGFNSGPRPGPKPE